MASLKAFISGSTKHDCLNKLQYKSSKELPKLKKVSINFWCNTYDLKSLSVNSLALELLTHKAGKLTISKKPNLLAKLRKGDPVGCKVNLFDKEVFNFLQKIVSDVIPKAKKFKGIFAVAKNNKEVSFSSNDSLSFPELAHHGYIFGSLASLNITIETNSTSKEELTFLLNSLKLKSNRAGIT